MKTNVATLTGTEIIKNKIFWKLTAVQISSCG